MDGSIPSTGRIVRGSASPVYWIEKRPLDVIYLGASSSWHIADNMLVLRTAAKADNGIIDVASLTNKIELP